MAGQLSARSEFMETLAVHLALRTALKTGRFTKMPEIRLAAENLCGELQDERSVYGKQLRMMGLMEKGASIGELVRRLRTSRRTVFRYLNNLENAGMNIRLQGGKYHVDRGFAKVLRP